MKECEDPPTAAAAPPLPTAVCDLFFKNCDYREDGSEKYLGIID